MITAEDAIRFYYNEISPKRAMRSSQPQWRLSETTVREIARSSGIDLDDEERFPRWKLEGTLCGLSIRIDDQVEGLSFEWIP